MVERPNEDDGAEHVIDSVQNRPSMTGRNADASFHEAFYKVSKQRAETEKQAHKGALAERGMQFIQLFEEPNVAQ